MMVSILLIEDSVSVCLILHHANSSNYRDEENSDYHEDKHLLKLKKDN